MEKAVSSICNKMNAILKQSITIRIDEKIYKNIKTFQ